MTLLNPRGALLLLFVLLGQHAQALSQGSQSESTPDSHASAPLSDPAAVGGTATEVLPIQAVVDRVLARQSDLRLAALAVEGAQAAVVTAKALPNPRVDWQTGRYRPFPNGQAGDTAAWVLAQPIENPWMRQARRAAAEAGVDVGDIHRIRDREPVRPVA